MALSSHATESDILNAIIVGFMGRDGGDRLFYYPTKDTPCTPEKYGCVFEDVFFRTADGVDLHGWWIPAKTKTKNATILYSHGNAGSLAYHLVFVHWLIDEGYNVMMYDYRGYGKSAGKISKQGLVEDAKAAYLYASNRDREGGIISIGHSLGGAKLIAALAELAPNNLKAVVVDSTFASYKDMAESVAGSRVRKIISASYEPYIYVKKLPPGIPLLIMHGTNDQTIPFAQAEKLMEAALPPKKLIRVEGGNHVNCFSVNEGKYRKILLNWLKNAISS